MKELLLREVVEAIAEADDTDPMELTPPIAAVVDPDALATVVESDAESVVEFGYEDFVVSVRSAEEISIRGSHHG